MKRNKSVQRRSYTATDGRRCSLLAKPGRGSLCLHHWKRRERPRDSEAAAGEFLGSFRDFKTPTAVNHALGELFSLIPVRRAAADGTLRVEVIGPGQSAGGASSG